MIYRSADSRGLGWHVVIVALEVDLGRAASSFAVTANLIFTIVFLGGWSGPGAAQAPLLGFIWLMVKTTIVYIPSLILRATIPRVRIDQMMALNWKFLVPVSIVNVLVMALLIKLVQIIGLTPSPDQATDFLAILPQAIVLLVGNLAIAAGLLAMLRNSGRQAWLGETLPAEEEVDALPASVAH